VEFKDYYSALGVTADAKADEIKKAYRRLARRYHPDVSKEADAERRMKEINEAYAVLGDVEKRAAYDQLRARGFEPGAEFRPPPDWDAGFERTAGRASRADAEDFSEFFSELFGRMGRGPDRRARGGDHHARILLDVGDSLVGATRQIDLRVPHLDASGRVGLRTRTLNVKIPRGVRSGQVIRLAGQGEPSTDGARAGDLLLEVEFRDDPRVRVDGADLLMWLPVAPWEAALGAVVPVTLPDGSSLQVRIPPGAQTGRRLRVRGRGLPGESSGDLVLTVRIVVPPAETAAARALYERMAAEIPFDARTVPEPPP
jgi:curved DNA-binding protein